MQNRALEDANMGPDEHSWGQDCGGVDKRRGSDEHLWALPRKARLWWGGEALEQRAPDALGVVDDPLHRAPVAEGRVDQQRTAIEAPRGGPVARGKERGDPVAMGLLDAANAVDEDRREVLCGRDRYQLTTELGDPVEERLWAHFFFAAS